MLAALFVLAACSDSAEPEPISAGELIELHVEDGVDEDVATCAISILVDDTDPEVLRPDDERSPVQELLMEETFTACGLANGLLDEADDEPGELAFSNEPQTYGDDVGLDALWDRCAQGDGAACDELWLISPVGSVYEQFGVTCGERLDVLNCTEELVLEPDWVPPPLVDGVGDATDEDGTTTDGTDENGSDDTAVEPAVGAS